MKHYLLIGLFLFTIGMGGCQSQSPKATSVAGGKNSIPYLLTADESHAMPKKLEEISGITFIKDQPSHIFAIQDEDGLLFEYDLLKKQIVLTTSFASKGDYEGLTTDGQYFYVLKSNGHIYSFPVGHTSASGKVIVNKDLVPKGEYESMAFDASSSRLFLLCKVCKIDNKREVVSGYILKVDESGRLSNGGEFSLQISALSALDKRIKKTFKPSAMARRESTGEWYILSSIDQALVITDDAFKPKEVIHLPRKTFEQPEGIAFDKDDNLYISSEAGRQKQGMIYKFNLIK